jgi:hypothetical protein
LIDVIEYVKSNILINSIKDIMNILKDNLLLLLWLDYFIDLNYLLLIDYLLLDSVYLLLLLWSLLLLLWLLLLLLWLFGNNNNLLDVELNYIFSLLLLV